MTGHQKTGTLTLHFFLTQSIVTHWDFKPGKADNHGGGLSFCSRIKQPQAEGGTNKGNCRVDCGEMQASASPQQAPKNGSLSSPRPLPRLVKLLLPTRSFNITLTCDSESKILCREILCNCSFFLLLLPIYPHLMYVLPCIFKRESFSFVVFFTLDKWCNGTKRRCVQRPYQD